MGHIKGDCVEANAHRAITVVQIMAGEGEGGLETHFVEMCNGLYARGINVVAIAHEKYADQVVAGVQFFPLDLTASRRNPIVLWSLWRILRRLDADIVHAQANKAAAMLSSISWGVAGLHIATVHNQKRSRKMFRAMDVVIGVSKGVLEPFEHQKLELIYNGVTPPPPVLTSRQELADECGLDAALPITLAAARLVPTKAFDNLINSWQREFGQLIIFGEGELKAELQRLVGERGLSDIVVLPGFRANVRSLFSEVDLLVFSSHREGFSYALVEALLARLPVVSTEVAGAKEVLPNELLVPVDDVAALNRTLNRALVDIKATQELMTPVFDWAQENLTVDCMVNSTRDVYLKYLS